LLLAYSGGLDSTVLLHALHALSDRVDAVIEAVHVHHGLQEAADDWQRHCRASCQQLGIRLHELSVDARPRAGESPEAAARNHRYAAIAGLMDEASCLLTAQHRDDQAETLLLQLLRGAGPRGLAAMPERTAFAGGWHTRPLLAFSRDELRAWAEAQALDWVEDSSNTDTRYDRNFIRHEMMPTLASRWPSVSATLARAANHQAEAAGLLDELALLDLQPLLSGQAHRISLDQLLLLPEPRQRNVLRYWIDSLGFALPSTDVLEQVLDSVCHSAADATPCVAWGGVEVRRYREFLYAMAALPPHDPQMVREWDPRAAGLELPDCVLTAEAVTGKGLKAALCEPSRLSVRYRQGGERCRPASSGSTRELKKLFQEAGVPPWKRERMPLIFIDGSLAAVPGYWVCEPCRAADGEPGFEFHLTTDSHNQD
jgi:tRNA(Ile)-lysidine synthase